MSWRYKDWVNPYTKESFAKFNKESGVAYEAGADAMLKTLEKKIGLHMADIKSDAIYYYFDQDIKVIRQLENYNLNLYEENGKLLFKKEVDNDSRDTL